MNTVVYKAFKRSIDNWEIDTSAERVIENGRKLFLVKIGVQQIKDSETGQIIDTAPITEYIYEDILRAVFGGNEEYTIRTCLGYTPQLIVTYENRLVMHNDEVDNEVQKVLKATEKLNGKDISESLVNSLLNYNTQAQISKEYRKLIKEINKECDEYYSPDFVGIILREHFFEQERNLTDYKEELHFMNAVELKEELGKSLRENDEEKISAIKEELMYAFLLGDIVHNPKISL